MKSKVQLYELRNMSDEELSLASKNTAEEVWKLRFQHHTGQLQNSASLISARRKLAQISTVMNERRNGIAPVPGKEA